jgi:hypothetical protein
MLSCSESMTYETKKDLLSNLRNMTDYDGNFLSCRDIHIVYFGRN